MTSRYQELESILRNGAGNPGAAARFDIVKYSDDNAVVVWREWRGEDHAIRLSCDDENGWFVAESVIIHEDDDPELTDFVGSYIMRSPLENEYWGFGWHYHDDGDQLVRVVEHENLEECMCNRCLRTRPIDDQIRVDYPPPPRLVRSW